MDIPIVGILLFDDVEPLDFVGPYETLIVANDETGKKLFEVYLVAKNMSPVRCFGGMKVIPDKQFSDNIKYTHLIIPGGAGARQLKKKSVEIDFLKANHESIETVLTVCTGSFVAATSGLYNDFPMTTHHSRHQEFRDRFPQITLISDKRYLDNETLITAGGITAGIDLTIYFIRKIYGEDIAKRVEETLEYSGK